MVFGFFFCSGAKEMYLAARSASRPAMVSCSQRKKRSKPKKKIFFFF